ncbi:MAG TPA: RNA-binding domain-containing protein, partial [Isosphaeraceae bacterium]|nr:RNA-binding domain-containing protein [Isosphaeraceae bacterium]
EWVEFKYNNSNPQEIGEYLSALSNSAALHRQPHGYIVWGIEDGTRAVKGTTFKPHRQKGAGNEDLEPWLARLLSPRIDFKIHEFRYNGHPVVLFEVQAANNTPVAFSGREWIRVGSHKKPLKNYPEKERELWRLLSAPAQDWSAQICERARLEDLDPGAIRFARSEYANKVKNDPKKQHIVTELPSWDDLTFLNKAKVCINGRITRTAIILLGRNESEHYLAPGIARITWVLKDEKCIEIDYEHFGPPLILAVDQVFSKVRNLTYRYLPDASLFPTEVTQYEPWVIRECLHNCIAHQDYTQGGKLNVVEEPGSLLFTNVGEFLPGSVEEVVARDAPPELYPNRFLAEAMVNLNMIDTIGSGIRRMFTMQRQRNFPMPDYDLSERDRVRVRIIGKVIDEKYTRMLTTRADLDLWDVIALDKVQKGRPISDEEFRLLKAKKLIEDRRPNLFVSAEVAAATETRAEYIKKRAFDKEHYKKMVSAYLGKFGEAKREDIDKLLMDKLSDALDDDQRRNAITNLLQEMRRQGSIRAVDGKRGRGSRWELSKPATGSQA